MESFNNLVKNRSYVAELSNRNKKSAASTPKYQRAVSMDDVIPKSNKTRKSVTKSNEPQWLNQDWSVNNIDQEARTSPNQKHHDNSVDTHTSTTTKKPSIDHNQALESNDLEKYEDPPDELSPTTTFRSSRTRETTGNSLSFVKVTNAVSKFEDLKSEAMNSWTEGVDLQLDSNSKTKKKSVWLSQSAFFDSGIEQQQLKEPTPVNNKKQTYSEVVDNKTPAWALHSNDTQPNNYTFSTLPVSNQWPQNETSKKPIPVVSSAFIPMMMPSAKDNELMLFLHVNLSNSNSRQALHALKKKAESAVLHSLHEITNRTFGLLLNALTLLLDYGNQDSETETARKIRTVWSPFNNTLTRFIQVYANLPDDLISVLKFIVSMARFFEDIHNDLPKTDILRVYDKMKTLVSSDTNQQLVKLLRQSHILPPEDDKWSSNEELLPVVPTAESLISEVIQKVNVLESYEARQNVPIVNNVQESWGDLDIMRYLLVHYMLLRDETVGPIQKVVKELFRGKGLDEIQVPECAIYEQTTPMSVSMTISSSEPCVIFKLGAPRPTDQLMEDLTEGSFVVLLSEITVPHHSSLLDSKKKVAELSMMGHIIRASSPYNSNGNSTRMVSIHIDKHDIGKIDWGGCYTLISTKLNAVSTMSTLKWLYEQSTDLKLKQFSSILMPRLLAGNNILTQAQLNTLEGEFRDNSFAANNDAAPNYLQGAEIDISCIMAKNGHFHARPREDVWPCLPAQWNQVSPSKRPPLYKLSPSQLSAVKFALTHRIAVISGVSGTGKTYLAGKLTQLITEALRAGQFHQPVLVITKSQSTLDEILSSMVKSVPDIIRFGPEPYVESLIPKQATRLAAPSVSDSNHRQYQTLEHRLTRNQSQLIALIKARHSVKNHDPHILSSLIPPSYLTAMSRGYQPSHHEGYSNTLSIWNAWARDVEGSKVHSSDSYETISHAQWVLESIYLKHAGRGVMPITDPSHLRSRFSSIANNPCHLLPISDATHWPFETSRVPGNEIRSALFKVWKQTATERIWHLTTSEKAVLIKKLTEVVLSFIDSEIEDLMQSQIKVSQSLDEILKAKLIYLCRFNRVIGMTSDFSAAHREWVSTLWPRAVIVDEASDIVESTLVSSILGPRTEHVILLGTSDSANRPRIYNPSLSSRNFDVSLFERWKTSANEFALLEEQWYMHSQVADVIDKFNSTKLETSSLLITAPMASCSENMVDNRHLNLEILSGITQRAFYINYQETSDNEINAQYTRLLRTNITQAEVDEAQFVALFAVYLSQQQYQTPSITVLTMTLLQKYLIRHIIREVVPKRTVFKSNVSKINIDVIEQYMGRHDNFVIVSTATPGYSSSKYDNLSRALTRARYGLFVVGKPYKDDVHERWNDFANYMKERELFGPAIQLTCYTHGDTVLAGHWRDFDKMKNGGCQRRCDTLMSDGHVCKEDCHFLSHDEIVCQEPCIRMRPSNCTHACQKKCFECKKAGVCPPCMVLSEVTLECGHTYKDVCHKLLHLDQISCQEIVHATLPCGHIEPVPCSRSHNVAKITCKKQTVVQLDCGHSVTETCGTRAICTEICNQALECGHKCQEICGVNHSHDRSQCTASCPKQLICGHQCAKGCANPDDHTEHCMEKCNYKCSHEYRCSRECWRDCIRCVSECPYKCDHYKCTMKCYEICNRPPCNKPCKKKLPCNHSCSGLCGERCPPCKICNPQLKCSISLRTLSEFEENEKVYMLPECGCVYSVESLDMYFENQAKNGEHTAIKLWDCPTCKKTIYTALRYNRYIKTEIALVNEIKLKLEEERQRLTQNEIKQIITAMNDETKSHAIHNIVGGRWFVCPNKHPYYVGDCGGATEVSKCPECDALIGGVEHRVVESNRFYGEFDGSEKPAWPGQPGAIE